MSPPAPLPEADSRTRVLDSAARLLAQDGAAAMTTRAVAAAAGVPTPTIFRLFGDKQGLVEALAERVMAAYAARQSEHASAEEGDPIEDLRAAWHAHVRFGLANPDLYLMLATTGRRDNWPAFETGMAALRIRIARLASAGMLRESEARTVDLVHAAGSGVVLALLSQQPDNRDEELADLALEGVLAAVLSTRPAPPTTELPTLVTTFRHALPQLTALSTPERDLLDEWLTRTPPHDPT